MSGPGTGRYTTYVPVASTRNTMLSKLFNARADSNIGAIYGKVDQTSNTEAAKEAVKTATSDTGVVPSNGHQVGDPAMFPLGVNLSFGNSPNIPDVKWTNAGDPTNPYVPDISSPGPGKTDPLSKDKDPGISVADMKASYVPGAPGTGTESPSVTSPILGAPPIGKSLTLGKSSA